MNILVTGGAGYIGSHTCVKLITMGHSVIIVDNFSNSDDSALDGIRKITKKEFFFHQADATDFKAIDSIIKMHSIDAVIHFAGLKAVGESVALPIEYYHNNILSTLTICRAMKTNNINTLIFSSSATVYKKDSPMPLTEDAETEPASPYGRTKLMCEQILHDCAATEGWSVALLRYFNPIGAHPSGLIGENPRGLPNNLMPLIIRTALGIDCELKIYGDDYPTADGTGLRDYIHVVDVANGHAKALDFCINNTGCHIFNIGIGIGVSVLELINLFESTNNVKIPYKISDRRPGDLAISYADISKAADILGFRAVHDLYEMCKDSWRYAKKS